MPCAARCGAASSDDKRKRTNEEADACGGCRVGDGRCGTGGGHDIVINGGKVKATGGANAAGIGGGIEGGASNIFIADEIVLKADVTSPPKTVIAHASISTDVASSLAGKQYATAAETFNASTWEDVKSNLEAGLDVTLIADVSQGKENSHLKFFAPGTDVVLDLYGHTVTCHSNSRLVIVH